MAEQSAPASPVWKRVYLDICALNRPLDDQAQMRIRLEADAVLLILSHVRLRAMEMAVSPAHLVEAAANPDPARREQVQALLRDLGSALNVNLPLARDRAESLHQLGLGVADAAHVALAELTNCDFVTVDDRLLRQMERAGVSIWFGTPMAFCEKENLR